MQEEQKQPVQQNPQDTEAGQKTSDDEVTSQDLADIAAAEKVDKVYDIEGLLAGGAAGIIVGIIISFDVLFAMQIGMFIGLIVGTRFKKDKKDKDIDKNDMNADKQSPVSGMKKGDDKI